MLSVMTALFLVGSTAAGSSYGCDSDVKIPSFEADQTAIDEYHWSHLCTAYHNSHGRSGILISVTDWR